MCGLTLSPVLKVVCKIWWYNELGNDMRTRILLTIMVFALGGSSYAQQFRISEYDGESLTIEYPPSFNGAYLFIEQSTNLADQVWDTVDYTQIKLVEGAPVTHTPSSSGPQSDGTTTNKPLEIPYVMTPEYIMAVANGEIENEAWTANSVWQTTKDGASGFFRIFGLSFVDSDGDGIDNVTEYANGTNPFTNDAPAIVLPADNGDPRPVPGSVNSTPGDWNTPPLTVYRNNGSAWQIINALTLALDGTNGTFTAQTTPESMGNWIASRCNGVWQAPAAGFSFPTVDSGSFYRTESASFQWQGMEKIYPLALTAYDGSEQFANHLIQGQATDIAGLAVLDNGTPVLVDGSNPWTEEKIIACLKHLKTVKCRLQKVSGGAFDSADTSAMAQAEESFRNGALTPKSALAMPFNWVDTPWAFNISQGGWYIPSNIFIVSRNQKFTFLNSLQQYGFGPSTHVGYVAINDTYDWDDLKEKWTLQASVSGILQTGMVCRTFQCSDGDSTWFVSGEINHTLPEHRDVGDYKGLTPAMLNGGVAHHHTGYLPHSYNVLTTLDLPPAAGQTLVMDSDRDGTISTNDLARVDESHPYRFWVNCDADDRNGDKYALPSSVTSIPTRMYKKDDLYADVPGQFTDVTGSSLNSIGSLNDLEDFFPVSIDWPVGVATNATVTLFSNTKIGVVDARLEHDDTDKYLTDLITAEKIKAKTVHEVDPATTPSFAFNANNVPLDKAFLIEAHEEKTNAMIWLTFDEGGGQVSSFTNYFSFTSVEKMYRYKNLRQGTQAGAPDRLDEPENWPDELCNDANYYYVHGFNVSEPRSRGSQGIMFKRLFWSGSNARFYGISWDGTPLGLPLIGLDTPCHYHNAVVNAFASAPALAGFLNSQIAGSRFNIVMAHSLGNVISSSAICDHGANVTQYYMINAAVAKEAYGDVTPNENMIPDGSLIHNQNEGFMSVVGYSWHRYPFETYSSEWYRLFTYGVDERATLTWRNRFGDIQTRTDAFNFYSSTEDILRVDEGYTALFSGPLDWDLWNLNKKFGMYAFQLQELFKGKSDKLLTDLADAGGGSDPYTGWGFTTESDTHITETPLLDIKLWPKNPRFYREQLDPANPAQRAIFLETLQDDPLFQKDPPELFGTGGSSFVGSTIGTCGFTFNYDVNNAAVSIANVPVRDYLLAKAFPARTGPLGSRPNGNLIWDTVNFDMSTQLKNPNAPDLPNLDKDWVHSAIRDNAYVYVCNFFKKITGQSLVTEP
jgi:hypothetical protein